jgi:hypothetical protein
MWKSVLALAAVLALSSLSFTTEGFAQRRGAFSGGGGGRAGGVGIGGAGMGGGAFRAGGGAGMGGGAFRAGGGAGMGGGISRGIALPRGIGVSRGMALSRGIGAPRGIGVSRGMALSRGIGAPRGIALRGSRVGVHRGALRGARVGFHRGIALRGARVGVRHHIAVRHRIVRRHVLRRHIVVHHRVYGCYRWRRIMTRYGWRLRWVNVCRPYYRFYPRLGDVGGGAPRFVTDDEASVVHLLESSKAPGSGGIQEMGLFLYIGKPEERELGEQRFLGRDTKQSGKQLGSKDGKHAVAAVIDHSFVIALRKVSAGSC